MCLLHSELSEIFKVSILQKISFAKMYRTIRVPAFEFKFNLVVCPLKGASNSVSKFQEISCLLNCHLHRVTVSSMF